MIQLLEITEENWLEVARLEVEEEQKRFLASPLGILARGYVYRDCRARVWAVAEGDAIIGVALVRDFADEPLGYDLQQFLIDRRYQNRGRGTEALGLILNRLRSEGRYDRVEVCVNRADAPALRVYEKVGFVDSGYVDPDLPECLNLVYTFTETAREDAEN